MKKGTYLFQEGDKADGIYFVSTGKVRIGKITPDGREITFRVCGNEDFIGELTLFCDPSTYTVSAEKYLRMVSVPKSAKKILRKTFLNHPKLAMEFIKWMGVHRQKTQSKFRDLISNGKKGAVLFNAHSYDE